MGVVTRRPPLPAPTDSSIAESAEESNTPTDLATDVSRLTDRSSHTIPEDGSPITIPTSRKRSTSGKLAKSSHSQTSLLIEYFEAGKGPNVKTKPSVRVKVHPSSSRRSRNNQEGEVVVTESHGDKAPSFRRRISLGTDSPRRPGGKGSVSPPDSEAAPRREVEVEVLRKESSEFSDESIPREA